MNIGCFLAVGTLKGLWTLETFDKPSGQSAVLERDRVLSHGCGGFGPVMRYPEAPPHRNLAREWIEANPREWEALMSAALEQEANPSQTAAPALP
jgi:hypothetical protein